MAKANAYPKRMTVQAAQSEVRLFVDDRISIATPGQIGGVAGAEIRSSEALVEPQHHVEHWRNHCGYAIQ